MKKNVLLLIALLSASVAGCSAPAANSDELDELRSQVEALQKENADLKAMPETTATESETEETTEAVSESGDTLAIGQDGALGDWTITVTNMEITDSIKENSYLGFSPEEGNKYLSIDITVTNNGKNAASFLPSFGLSTDISAKLLYQGDYKFSSTNLLGHSKDMHNSTVNPLSSKSGIIAFEIPDSVASSEEELILVISQEKSDLQVKVR